MNAPNKNTQSILLNKETVYINRRAIFKLRRIRGISLETKPTVLALIELERKNET